MPIRSIAKLILLISAVSLSFLGDAEAQTTSRKLVICGGGSLPDSVFEEFRMLAGSEPKLTLIPTASSRKYELKEARELWAKRGFQNVDIFNVPERIENVSEDKLEKLRNATAIWIGGGIQQRLADIYVGTNIETELMRLLENGVVIGGTSAGAAIQSKIMIAGGRNVPELSTGFDFLPKAIIDQHFLRRNRMSRLQQAVRSHSNLTGFGIDEGTALIMNEGKLKVAGRSFVIRICQINGELKFDSFGAGDTIN